MTMEHQERGSFPKAVSAPAWPSAQGHQPQMTMYGHPMCGFAPPGMMLPPGPLQQSLVNEADNQNQDFEGGNQCGASAAGESDDGRSQRGFGRRVRQSRRSRSRSRPRRSSRSDSRSARNTRDKRRLKRSRKARDRRRRSASESQSENELQPEILALFDNNNPYANADSTSLGAHQ